MVKAKTNASLSHKNKVAPSQKKRSSAKREPLPPRKCDMCDNIIQSPTKVQKYCSRACNIRNVNDVRIKRHHGPQDKTLNYRLCRTCGKYIEKFGHWRACSEKCLKTQRHWQQTNQKRNCWNCDTQIVGTYQRRYCDNKCRREHHKTRRRKRPDSTDKICRVCDKVIEGRIRTVYCSKKCYNKNLKKPKVKKIRKCRKCGNDLQKRQRLYCSIECRVMHNAKREIMRAEMHSNMSKENLAGQNYLDEYAENLQKIRDIDYKK